MSQQIQGPRHPPAHAVCLCRVVVKEVAVKLPGVEKRPPPTAALVSVSPGAVDCPAKATAFHQEKKPQQRCALTCPAQTHAQGQLDQPPGPVASHLHYWMGAG
ncbi:hypothetical protein HaLaN_10673 [Haematococcus lacustris]|uniref:Uncharacterized protein n=1 Tax=Haematococcus lacustris TaxID=44745 RepID=A0A699YWG5_HAELA|nr:hypothetical protein HaLaN_10673 [Haematococcus lacustris]